MLKRMRTYLGVIFAIFARDVKRVLRNPVALVIALGMIVMPSAYAWYVVVANWDPYSNTTGMLVAVANEDAGADSPETGHLDVGAQVVAQLHDNHEMGWEFTDAEAAINGVYEGRYWAALVIPKDFSADFASVFTGDFTQPTIDYYVNEKPSSIAPKVTDAAANAAEAAVNENFVKTVSEKVVETTQKVGAEAQTKADAAEGSLTAGVRSAKETVSETRTTLEGLVGTVGDTRTSIARADDTLAGLQDDVPHLLEAIGQSKELLAKARSTVNEYGTALSKNAIDGALQLSSAAAQAQRTLGTVSGDVAAAEAATNAALATAEGLLADNKVLISDLTAQAGAAGADPAIAQALSEARAANERLTTTTDALRTASDDLASTADSLEAEASALDTAAQSASETIRTTAATFQDSVLPDITSSLDSLVEACGTLEGALRGLTPSLAEARAILEQLGDTLTSSETSLSTTSDSLSTMETNLEQSLTDLTALQNSATVKDLAGYLKADPEKIGAFMAAPVALDTQLVYPVKNYGSGVTPFFTNLALWVAGFILMAMVKLRVDPEGLPKFTAVQAYFGRWLFYMVCGLAMGLVCCVGDLALGIQCESPAAFIGAGLLTVFVDVNLMFALAYAFRHIGKAIAVILLIVQIPGSSGMFPIEMMPDFFPVHSSASALHLLHRRHARGHRRLLRSGLPARHAVARAAVRSPGVLHRARHRALRLQPEPHVRREAGGDRPAFGRARDRQRQSRRADAGPVPHAHARPRAAEHRRLPPGPHRPSRAFPPRLPGTAAHRLGGAYRATAGHLRHYGAGACRRGYARHDAHGHGGGDHRGGHVSHRDFIPGHQPRAPACPGEPERRGAAETR